MIGASIAFIEGAAAIICSLSAADETTVISQFLGRGVYAEELSVPCRSQRGSSRRLQR
jgi:hypothetical protein